MSLELARRDQEGVRRMTRRGFVLSVVVHALLFAWLALVGGKHDGPTVITEVTWLEPKDLEAPKPPPPPPAPPAPTVAKPVPPPAVVAPPKPVAPKPPAPKPQPAKPVQKPGDTGVARAPANGGAKGREAGARVATAMRTTTASIDNMLAGLGGGTANVTTARSAGAASDRYAVRGGRGDGARPTADGALRGTGLGEVGAGAGGGRGAGHGMARMAVAIADQGVETNGDGANASGRDSRSLMATVQRYVAGIKFCYDNALKKTPALRGTITLQMDIAASGEVTSVEPTGDTMGNAALERCILSQVQAWKFAAIPAGVVRFTLPLVFSPPQLNAQS